VYKIPIIILFAIILLPIFAGTADSYESNEIEEFENWANENGITIVGVNKNSDDLHDNGYDPKTDYVNWKEIPRVLIAAEALYKVPKNVIKVMDGKTIYFSTEYGRSYSVFGKPMPTESVILKGVDRGIILDQNINPHTVLHELGHIVDYHGIQGRFDDKQHIFDHVLEDRISIFNVTQKYQPNSGALSSGYITLYSTKNNLENFAENFAYYIQFPNEFRERIQTDTLLTDEYEFMRDKIFLGFEY